MLTTRCGLTCQVVVLCFVQPKLETSELIILLGLVHSSQLSRFQWNTLDILTAVSSLT